MDDCQDGMVVEDLKSGQLATQQNVHGKFPWFGRYSRATICFGLTEPGPRAFSIDLPPAAERRRNTTFIPGDRVDVLDTKDTEQVLVRGLTVLRVDNDRGFTTVTVQLSSEQALAIAYLDNCYRLDLRLSGEDR
jgi:hypothetical protein